MASADKYRECEEWWQEENMIFMIVQLISMIKLETDGINCSIQASNFLTLSYFSSNDLLREMEEASRLNKAYCCSK